MRFRVSKRIFDLSFGLLLLLTFSPVIAFIAMAIRVTMGGPVFFRDRRPGFHGRLFTLYKFRTMLEINGPDGLPLPDADRLTLLGRWLRLLSLDELPQLWNVVCGELSLVGPRPLLSRYLPLYSKEQFRRHDVPPGITGWAQINGRNAIGWDEKFSYDLWYVDHWSFWLDVKILLMTIGKVIVRSGVNQIGHATMPEFKGQSTNSDISRSTMSRIYLSPPHMGFDELDLVRDAFESNWIAPLGPHVDALEREFAEVVGVPHAVALSSGTAALHLALRVLGLGDGGDVLCSTLTFIASAAPIIYEGGHPIFIDSEAQSWAMDADLLEDELERRVALGCRRKR